MGSYPDQGWLERSNALTLHHLERQGRTSPGLVPFLGAGISTPYGFKNWKGLLLSAAPPRLLPKIQRQLEAGKYEEAAESLLKEMGDDGFQAMVAAAAGDTALVSFDFRLGAVSLLPLLAGGPVVTTNFDRVLERAFQDNGAPFEQVISGPRPDLIVDALQGNRRVLMKLHGDWQDRVGRTFAKSDYDANYGEAQPERKRELLDGTENLLFSSRAMLFIGSSLGPDRTVKVLRAVQRKYAGIHHFAIMSLPKKRAAFEQQEQHLRECGVLPLWYAAETGADHALQVERLVSSIVERISVRTIAAAKKKRRPPAAGMQRAPAPTTGTPMPGLNAHFDRVVRLTAEGRLTFFLGSAIHHEAKLTAREFYAELARLFECEALNVEPFAVAQYIADRYGRDNLYAEIRKLFANITSIPGDTDELFAAWKGFKNSAGEMMPYPMVMTTNYDDVLERRLANADLPYHLLSYQADGSDRGRFYHRTPDGGLRVIERPRNIRALSNGFVVVKLNGGIDREGRIPESYTTTRLDFWDLATRIPDALPAAVQERLSASPILFLGHGLAAPDIESVVRFAHRDHTGPRSWAVVKKKEGIEYWRQCGVEILDQLVDPYVNELRRRLAANGPTGTRALAAAGKGAMRKGKIKSGS